MRIAKDGMSLLPTPLPVRKTSNKVNNSNVANTRQNCTNNVVCPNLIYKCCRMLSALTLKKCKICTILTFKKCKH